MTTHPDITVLDDPDRVIEVLSPIRRRILAELDEPASATVLAGRLATSRQRVNYHLRALEEAGLVEFHEARPRRGLTERVMRRASDIIVVDPGAFDAEGLATSDRVGLGGVVAMATELIRLASRVTAAAGDRRERVVAASLDAEIRLRRPSDLDALLTDLADVMARHDSPGDGLRVRVGTAVLSAFDA